MPFISILHVQYYEYRKWKQEQKKAPDIFNGKNSIEKFEKPTIRQTLR